MKIIGKRYDVGMRDMKNLKKESWVLNSEWKMSVDANKMGSQHKFRRMWAIFIWLRTGLGIILFVNTIMHLVAVTGEKFIEQMCRTNLLCGIS